MADKKEIFKYKNILPEHKSIEYVKYCGLKLISSKHAERELLKYGLMLEDCKAVLEDGYAPRKRGEDTIEKWMDYQNKTYNVVVVKTYNEFHREYIYLIKHVGRFTRK